MHDIFDLKGYIDKLIATINETCDNARNALNILMGISVVMGGLILGVDDEILFLDQGASVPYAGIPITVSTVFALFPVVYLVIYGLLGLKLLSIVNITKEFTTTRDILIYKTESELLYPLTQYTHLLLKIAPSAYNNQLKSFFFLDALLHKGRLAIGISLILLYVVPLAILIKGMLVFLPYQSWIISINHWIVISALTMFFSHISGLTIIYNKRKSAYCTLLHTIPNIFFTISLIYFSDRMDNGKIDENLIWYFYPEIFYPKTAIDLSNKTLVKKPTSDAILAVAYQQDLHNKDKTHFEKTKWEYAEGHLLRNRSFKGINLSYANAYKIDLQGSDLTDADLNYANLMSANFTYADLSSANFTYADLSSANLTGADLNGTDLTGADLTGADLANAVLIGANLANAVLIEVTLKGTIYNSKKFGDYHKKTNFGKNIVDESKMIDICTQIIDTTEFNEKNKYLTKRKKVGDGYDYSAYCVD